MHPNVLSSIIYNYQDMEADSVSINRWMDKEYVKYIDTHNGILFSHKKEWNFAIYGNIDGLGGYYAKWNVSEKKTNTVWHHLCVESKIYRNVVNITKQKQTQIQRTN